MVHYAHVTISGKKMRELAQNSENLTKIVIKVKEYLGNLPQMREVYENNALNYNETKQAIQKAPYWEWVKDKWTPEMLDDQIKENMLRATFQKDKQGNLIINPVYKEYIESREVKPFIQCVNEVTKNNLKAEEHDKWLESRCSFSPYMFGLPTYDWDKDKNRPSYAFYRTEYHEKDLQAFKALVDKNVPEFRPFIVTLREEP